MKLTCLRIYTIFLFAYLPKSKRFVSCSCNQHISLAIKRHVKNSVSVSFERLSFFEVLQRPDVDLELLEPVTRNYFICLLWKQNVANLTLCLMLHYLLSFAYVPDSDFLIRGSRSACQNVRVVWRPCDCLYGCLMSFFDYGEIRFQGVNEETIIVSTWRKVLRVKGPFESHDFLVVTLVLFYMLFSWSQIKEFYFVVSWSWKQLVVCEADCCYSRFVLFEIQDLFVCDWINEFQLSLHCSHCNCFWVQIKAKGSGEILVFELMNFL